MIDEYLHLMSDPAHMLVEFTFVLIDVILIKGAYTLLLRHLHRDITAGRHKK